MFLFPFEIAILAALLIAAFAVGTHHAYCAGRKAQIDDEIRHQREIRLYLERIRAIKVRERQRNDSENRRRPLGWN